VATVTVGVDIGQKHDPTAVAVVELEYRDHNSRRDDHWLVRHLERLPLGTPYPQVADRLAKVVEGVRERAGTTPPVYLDATGVGQPIADEMQRRGLAVSACYFTYGDRRTVEGYASVKIGKAWLVSRMLALLQGGRLHLPDTSEAHALADELMDYEIRVDENANDRYGAFKVGTHDDLVTALGLAVQQEPFEVLIGWVSSRGTPSPYGPPSQTWHVGRFF